MVMSSNRVVKVERFEDLIAWQKARGLVQLVYEVTSRGTFARDYDLKSQFRRASVSVMSNIAEGFERGGRTEFHQFLSIAKASCGETRSLIYVAFDAGYVDDSTFAQLLSCASEVNRITNGLRMAVAPQRDEQRSSRRSPGTLSES
jgi:four helix bundle protein